MSKMNNIQIISASAGSGKTYRLAEALREAITENNLPPESVIAMTFTNKAAAELHERVRRHLLSQGKVDEARKLSAARIGTVNAVCGQFVQDFAFELGLSPELTILDETASEHILSEAFSRILSLEEENQLADLESRFSEWDWKSDLRKITTSARANCLHEDQLKECARQSKEEYKKLLGNVIKNSDEIDLALINALTSFMDATTREQKLAKKTQDAINLACEVLGRLQHRRTVPWSEWVKLSKLDVEKKLQEKAMPVCLAAALHHSHPRLHQDIGLAIDLVFTLGCRVLQTYQQHKKEMGAIDFIDQETFTLNLLRKPSIQKRIQEKFQLVLVDEFQDTSPIQLAIFLELAKIIPHNVWVGDQKQAIYNFRGTDPTLMDAVIDLIGKERKLETLGLSYRSRAPLVKLTSDLFAPAFAHHGLPEERTRLTPKQTNDIKDLGPIAECWNFQTKNKDEDSSALASAVKQFLNDKTVKVRDPKTKTVRPLHRRDVAILCRTNDTCAAVADDLEELGIRSILPRTGLMETLEARIILAGLQLWADPRDSLAAAQLARIIHYPEQGNDWLNAILQKTGIDSFSDLHEIQALLKAREDYILSGIVEVLDHVIEATGVWNLCHRWGNTATRTANLEALRSFALGYVQVCSNQGIGCTVPGLITYFSKLTEDSTDMQGVTGDQDTVVVSTWHKAKGLEWPVTVLFELNQRSNNKAAMGVTVTNTKTQIDLENPLAGRWIRYWPYPYNYRQTTIPLLDELANNPAEQQSEQRDEQETLRLLYVGWTRARDRIILAGRQGKIFDGIIDLLNVSEQPMITEPEKDYVIWAGNSIEVKIRTTSPESPSPYTPIAENGYAVAGNKIYPPAVLHPSEVKTDGSIGQTQVIGSRVNLIGRIEEWDWVGNAVHAFLAADQPSYSIDLRLNIARRLLTSWSVDTVLRPEDLLSIMDSLRKWITIKWPEAKWYREWPLQQSYTNGSILRGQMDLVLETQEGYIIIDHKTFPGSASDAEQKAVSFSGQIDCYTQALIEATKKPVLEMYIHLPILGLVIPVGLPSTPV